MTTFPKPKKKSKHAVSDSYLLAWWRKAVRAVWGNNCVHCGAPATECHHVTRRGKGVLRHDYRNGIPLCLDCHAWVDRLEGRQWVESNMDMEYLSTHDVTLKDFLQQEGLSRREFEQMRLAELKAVAGVGA